jgi:capsid protein
MIDISKTTVSYQDTSSTTINGIVRNKWGQITHLYLFKDHKKTRSEKVKYDNITYYSEVWLNIDQQVAVSKLTSMLSKIDKTTQYENSELQSAIEESKAGHYIKSSAYNELMRVVADEVANHVSGTGAERIRKVKDLVTPILRDLSNLGVKPKGLTPIASGDDVQFNNTKRDSQYKDMNNNSEKKSSASQGLSDIGVYSKASEANYSSIKYTLETDQRTADIRFDNIKAHILDEILERLIMIGVQIGRITERVAYWNNPYAFNKFRYLRQNKIDTEPAKNAQANKTNIELGIETEADIIEKSKGVSYEDFLKKRHEQKIQELKYDVEFEKARQKAYKDAGIEFTEKSKSNEVENTNEEGLMDA